MVKKAGIIGSGLMGRIMALELNSRGWDITLFDRDDKRGRKSCAFTAAGMIAPTCELESAEREMSSLGMQSLQIWPEFLAKLVKPVFFKQKGSLVVAHPSDENELEKFERRILKRSVLKNPLERINADRLTQLEPGLERRFKEGLFISEEAHLDNVELLNAMAETIVTSGLEWRILQEVNRMEPFLPEYDWIIDCRGMGAKNDLKNLRGIRGEIMGVWAPEVHLEHPIRVMHPRYPLYIVPRPDQIYVLGATAIDSEDYRDITVRSALELLSAAYALHSGFAEATLLFTRTNCRPAFPDHKPKIILKEKVMRINGLYRHGFLLAPVIAKLACDYLENEKISHEANGLFQESA